MDKLRVEDVYKTEGVPPHTFVKPPNYGSIYIDFRAANKPVIIEGQSGTGKTTVARAILKELYPEIQPPIFSGRREADIAKIQAAIDNVADNRVLIIDDFHRLDDALKQKIGDLIKVYAESDTSQGSKIIIIGINKSGSGLIQLVPDLAKRIGIFKIAPATKERTFELIAKGEAKLNISVYDSDKELIFKEAEGDYWLIQKLAQELCLINEVHETLDETTLIRLDMGKIRERLVDQLDERYKKEIVEFCRGRRFRQSNRPYLKLLMAVSQYGKSAVNLELLSSEDPKIKPSVDQIKKSRLKELINDKVALQKYFYYDPNLVTFSIEDPAVSYYIKHLDWDNLRKDAGFVKEESEYKYEVAFSFAGNVRELVEYVKSELDAADVSVFYDKDYESKLLGANLEAEFLDTYMKDARYVAVFINKEYAERLWTRFETTCYKNRVEQGAIIPIRLDDAIIPEIPEKVGRISFAWNPSVEWKPIVKEKIVDVITSKIKS